MFMFRMANLVGMGHVPEPLQGSAPGLVNTGIQIGAALGIAVGATVVSTTGKIQSAFVVGFAFAIMCGLVAAPRLRGPIKRQITTVAAEPPVSAT